MSERQNTSQLFYDWLPRVSLKRRASAEFEFLWYAGLHWYSGLVVAGSTDPVRPDPARPTGPGATDRQRTVPHAMWQQRLFQRRERQPPAQLLTPEWLITSWSKRVRLGWFQTVRQIRLIPVVEKHRQESDLPIHLIKYQSSNHCLQISHYF